MSGTKVSARIDSSALFLRHDRTAWLKGREHRCLMPPNTPAGRVWRIVLLGAPGVGKDTQAELLCQRLGACHLSTGDVLRVAKSCVECDLSPAMKNALDLMKRGELVPDETVLNLVGERLGCLNCSGGFVLDGFPRTVAQAKALEQVLDSNDLKLTAVFNYNLPINQIAFRISGRRTCANCKAVFHTTTRPPNATNVCDQCGGNLFQRENDRPEVVKVRMETYLESAQPLIKFYREHGLLIDISADGTPEEIYERTRKAVFTE
jgi:adenylate kinase